MSLFPTIRSADRSPLRRDRSAKDPRSPLTGHVEAEFSLPRHLLVSLAGISADVTSLQQRCGDAPHLQAAVGTILGRLDGLVDSIYQHAADPGAFREHRSGDDAGSPSGVLAEVPVDVADASNVAATHPG